MAIKITRVGVIAPDWAPEEIDTPDRYVADCDGDMRATAYPIEGGYGIETWNDAVGLTTYWRADTMADAVAFADGVVA